MSRNFDLMQEMERGRMQNLDWAIKSTLPIPDESRTAGKCGPLSSDAALELVQKIFLLQTQTRPRVAVFAGIDHGNGCSEVAASVAQALAGNACGGVCLVEANFRSPSLPALFGTTNHYGLTDALLQEAPIRSMIKPICNGRLWLLSCGSPETDAPNLLTSERLKERFAELRQEFEFVIVDAPPMTLYADAIALGKLSDGVVVVVEAESTRREAALSAVEALRSSQVQILGAVLNKRTFPIPESIYSRL